MKQEFDKYRAAGTLPPVLTRHGIKGTLYAGKELATWRENFKGVQYFDEDLNAMLYGAVDDVLQLEDGSLAVIDYKSTGSREIKIYDDYQKQMEVYTYLLDRNGFETHNQAYFVFYQVDKTGGGFQNSLPFIEHLKAVTVNKDWVNNTFEQAVTVARRSTPPQLLLPCQHCLYVQQVYRVAPFPAPDSDSVASGNPAIPAGKHALVGSEEEIIEY